MAAIVDQPYSIAEIAIAVPAILYKFVANNRHADHQKGKMGSSFGQM